MEEKFDKQLSGHIRNVFEEYEDASAEQGWDRLREKYPEKECRLYAWWWTSFAAASLLLLAFWLFWPVENPINYLKSVQNKHQTENLKPIESLNKVSISKKNIRQKKNAYFPPLHPNKTKQADNLVADNLVSDPSKHQKQQSGELTISNKISIPKKQKQLGLINNQTLAEDGFPTFNRNNEDSLEKENPIVTNFIPLKEARQLTFEGLTIDQNLMFQPEIKMPVKTVLIAKVNQVKQQGQHKSKFSFGVYVDTHLNFSKGSNNQFGLGAGFFTDYQLLKKLKLSTGLAIIQNKLFYTSNFPQNPQTTSTNYSTSVSGVSTVNNIQNLNSLGANLLVLDLPINLKYKLYSDKNSMFIAVGISSNAFVNESYTYNYTNTSALYSLPNQPSSTTSSTQQSVKINKSFKSFDFARTLNLSFGFAYPLGKNQIQIEPFLKYPLIGLGSQQLNFSAAGINLKLNFQSVKKKKAINCAFYLS